MRRLLAFFRQPTYLERQEARVDHLEMAYRSIGGKLDYLIRIGDSLMKASDQIQEFLADLNTSTNAMAAEEAKQTALLAEVTADIDALLTSSGSLDQGTVDQLTAASAKLKTVVAFEQAQTVQLQGIAAKNDIGAPAVPPAPVPQPPVEGGGTTVITPDEGGGDGHVPS